jgi:Nuclease A inhibitor-like protein
MNKPTPPADSSNSTPNPPIAKLLEQLQAAIEGLQWMSESDFPFEVVHWSQTADLTPELLLKLTDHTPETPVQTEAIASFFEVATQSQDWHGPEEAAAVERYRHLLQVLSQLRSSQVYRLGEVNVEIYILGTAADRWLGVKTQAVET